MSTLVHIYPIMLGKKSINYTVIEPKLFAQIISWHYPFNSEEDYHAYFNELESNMMQDDFSGPNFVISIVGTGINFKF